MFSRAFLYQRTNYERMASIPVDGKSMDLHRMAELWNRLKGTAFPDLLPGLLPGRSFPARCVHVAGTKGKGSTCFMLESILTSVGISTGLFTSPEIRSVEERIRINGRPCTPEQFDRWLAAVQPIVEQMDITCPDLGPVTFFEITVAMAFYGFMEQNVDVVILETGLGGRNDATNICSPDLTAITSIGLEHTAVLGCTEEQIAGHKAGIIKPGVPVVVGQMSERAYNVIQRTADSNSAPLLLFNRDFGAAGTPGQGGAIGRNFDYWECEDNREKSPENNREKSREKSSEDNQLKMYRIADIALSVLGEHQLINAAMAIRLGQLLASMGMKFSEKTVSEKTVSEVAVRSGLASLHLPARADIIRLPDKIKSSGVEVKLTNTDAEKDSSPSLKETILLIDGAHTIESVIALTKIIIDVQKSQRIPITASTLVFACASDKKYPEIIPLLSPLFGQFYLTRFQKNPRSVSPDELSKYINSGVIRVFDNINPVMNELFLNRINSNNSLSSLSNRLVVVTGSFYLSGEVYAWLDGVCG